MSSHCRKHWATLVAVAGAFAVLSGCGSKLGTAEGPVTFDGQPVVDGAISFESVEGNGPSAGGVIQGGKYRIERIAPGKKIVRITAQRKTGRKVPLSTIMPPEMVSPNAMTDEIERYIPANYNTHSELTAEVGSGRNKFEFDLKSR